MYLKRNSHNHPSFNCYIEVVNEFYAAYNNSNGNKQTKKASNEPKAKNKTINAVLNMKYGDNSHQTFYCSYKFRNTEVKGPMLNNNTSIEDDYELAMHWLNLLTTVVAKDKSVSKLVIETSAYIYEMIVDNKLGNRTMTSEEKNRIKSYLGRVKKLGMEVSAKK